jgi:hypothetical protein
MQGKLLDTTTFLSSVFSFDKRKLHRVTIPTVPNAIVSGVNPEGTALLGYYQPSGSLVLGFSYQNNTFRTLQFPGALGTYAIDSNSAGEVVGYFVDSSNNEHCFTWTPPADAGKK